jgi:8-oxo-dGTP pyrophosphatase MutT (NUDIX family)
MKTAAIKAHIRDEVDQVSVFDDLEQAHKTDILQWIDSGANLFRIAKPDKPPKHLVSYFVLIDPDHKSVLLGDHIKAQLWLPSGGHVELNEQPKQTVVRESREELGQEAVFLGNRDQPFFVTVTDTVGLTPGHTDVSLWYLLRGSVHDTIDFERREFNDMTWFTFDEILQSHPAIFDRHMQRFNQKLVSFLA